MSASAKQVADLLFRLKSARSPFAKVKVLQQAWQVLHGLTPSERRQVATELGFAGADSIVDRLAAERGGIAPELLHELLDKAEGADPERVEALAHELRDPQRRQGVLDRGLEAVETFVRTGAWPGQTAAPPRPATEVSSRGAPTPSPPPPASPAGPPRASAAAPPPVVPHPPPFEPAAPPAPRQPVPATPPLPSAAAACEPTPRPAWMDGPRPHLPETLEVPAEPSARAADASEPPVATWTADLRATRSVLARLRALREHRSSLAASDPETLRQTLAAFPEPWARRRALLALLHAGVPTSVSDALALIDEFPSAHDRRWCLAFLARSRDLSSTELESVLARLGPGAARRLLAGRRRVEPGDPFADVAAGEPDHGGGSLLAAR